MMSQPLKAQDDFSNSANGSDSYHYYMADLHDIVTDPEKRKKLLPALESLIRAQANFHQVEYFGDLETLEESIWKRGNTFRGFLVYAQDRMPIAYAVYYPMIDSQGRRAAYCEDAYVAESFRRTNLFDIVMAELAKRITEEGCDYLQWSTDRRNDRFKTISRSIGATRPDIVTLAGDDIIKTDKNTLKNAWAQNNYISRLINPSDINLLKSLNMDPNLIRNNGDIDFKGFITFHQSDLRKPVAITPGWEHLSTFRVTPGIYLENPTFQDNATRNQKAQILYSVVLEAQKYTADEERKLEYLKWHINRNDVDLMSILNEDMSLPVDCMKGPGRLDSEMIVHTLSNGNLQKLCDKGKENEERMLHFPINATIGPKARRLDRD